MTSRLMRQGVIFGGAGFIGSNVAHSYLAEGRSVLIFDSLCRPGVEKNLLWLKGQYGSRLEVEILDIRNARAVCHAVRHAEEVFHFAAQVAVTTSLEGPVHDFEVNACGTLNVLGALRAMETPAPLVFTSTNEEARTALADAGITYAGWLPNHEAPRAFSRARVTVHVPRRPYVLALPGIPTIRVFEALACGIPLVSAPWWDAEGLFKPGRDFLIARTGEEMQRVLGVLLADDPLRRELAEHGRRTVLARHTCAHRVDELLIICRELGMDIRAAKPLAQERSTA